MKSKDKKDKKKKEKVQEVITDEPILANGATNGAAPPLEIHHGDIKAEARKIKNDDLRKGTGPAAN